MTDIMSLDIEKYALEASGYHESLHQMTLSLAECKWNLGRILNTIDMPHGDGTLVQISDSLMQKHPGIRGVAPTELRKCMRAAERWDKEDILTMIKSGRTWAEMSRMLAGPHSRERKEVELGTLQGSAHRVVERLERDGVRTDDLADHVGAAIAVKEDMERILRMAGYSESGSVEAQYEIAEPDLVEETMEYTLDKSTPENWTPAEMRAYHEFLRVQGCLMTQNGGEIHLHHYPQTKGAGGPDWAVIPLDEGEHRHFHAQGWTPKDAQKAFKNLSHRYATLWKMWFDGRK